MVEAVEFARKYKGKLTVIKADGDRVELVLNKLDELRIEPNKKGVMEFKKMTARCAVRRGRKLLVDEFNGVSNKVTLELELFDIDDEPAGVVVVDPATIESAASGSALIGEVKQDMVDCNHEGLVWEEITFLPKSASMRND
ncbi:MAG: hypothetical protein GY841_15525 [FCB group bacterium]|nr:hypothetical protein [FCB group bacterium]